MNYRRGRAVSGAFVFLLLGLFALSAALMVLFGAQAYRAVVQRTEMHNDGRILSAYIVNAVQADDASGAVSVREIDGMDVLHVACEFDGEGYGKWIYCDGEFLRELFTADSNGFDPAAGEIVCAAGDMSLSREGNLITAVITDDYGRTHEAQAALRCAD